MSFPPAFSHFRGRVESLAMTLGRQATEVLNYISPGKRRAKILMVANERTRQGLPACARHVPVVELVENGVDLDRFSVRPSALATRPKDRPVRFVYVGRLVDWKAVDLLLEAFAGAPPEFGFQLEILGDGDQRPALEALSQRLGISERVFFRGFVEQDQLAGQLNDCDVLVLPSLYECGGAVVLEAMAKGMPVIATAWGGPSDYLNAQCGVLVPPTDRETIIHGFRDAMVSLGNDEERRTAMGRAGRERVASTYDWDRKMDRMLEIYEVARV